MKKWIEIGLELFARGRWGKVTRLMPIVNFNWQGPGLKYKNKTLKQTFAQSLDSSYKREQNNRYMKTYQGLDLIGNENKIG